MRHRLGRIEAGVFLVAIGWFRCSAEPVAVAHPGEEFDPRATVVWTPLFQAAWDELNKEFGKPVKIEPENKLMTRLDTFSWNAAKTMPKKGWKVWAGEATQDLVDRANAEAAEMTGEKGPFSFSEGMPGSQLALGLLHKDAHFQKALYRAKSASLDFRGAKDEPAVKVAFFGVRGEASGGHSRTVQVQYRAEGSFAVAIASKDGEVVVCDLPESSETLEAAVKRLRTWRNSKPKGEWGAPDDPNLHEGDDLRIPFLRLDTSSNFAPRLQGARHFKSQPVPRRIFMARQDLVFELSEKGARFRAKVALGDDPFGEPPAPPPMIPRKLHFDRPFFVFLWREGADWPYFGAWIGDAAAMERVE